MKILFIGNSYTYYNDMPQMLLALAKENGKDVSVDAVTKGGKRLYENLKEGDSEGAKIRELLSLGGYDVLVLQEQSHTPLSDPKSFLEGARGLGLLVGAPRTVLYATWGRKDGCPLLDELGMTSLGMSMMLELSYERMAKLMGATIAPVGRAFAAMTSEHPGLELYSEDMSHPSYMGSALAAIVLYKTIFEELPAKSESIDLDGWITSALIEIAEGI